MSPSGLIRLNQGESDMTTLRVKYVEYHSKDWELLAEMKWTTATVEEITGLDGKKKRIAFMIS